MATAVQLTLSLDAQQPIGMISRLQALWERLKAKIAEGFGSGLASFPAAEKKVEEGFNGIEAAERRAHIGGKLVLEQMGIHLPRAFETVLAHSKTLGPILAGMFNVAVFATAISAISEIGEKLKEAIQSAGGYTEEIKKMEEETKKASEQAFVNPQKLGDAIAHLDEVNRRIEEAQEKIRSIRQDQNAGYELSNPEATDINDYREKKAEELKKSEQEITELNKQQNELLKVQGELTEKIVNSYEEQAKLAGLKGFAKVAEEERQAMEKFNKDFGPQSHDTDQYKRGVESIHAIYAAQRNEEAKAELDKRRQVTDETMKMRQSVVEDALQGEARVKQAYEDEMESLRMQLSRGLINRQDFHERSVLLAQKAAEKLAQINEQNEKETEDMERRARDATLKGDDLILAHRQDQLNKNLALYSQHLIDVNQYLRRIVAINKEADAQITANDEQEAQRRKQILDQEEEERKTAEQAVALASVDEWHRADAQILISAQNRIAAIDKQERNEEEKLKQGSAEYVSVEAAAQAKRAAVWAETDQRIREEHKRQVDALGADLESVFNDISSGNIGKRIIANMKKLFFQILAEWLLTTQMMNSSFGSIFGNLIFGPGSAGSNFFGSGGLGIGGVLGGLFGGGSSPIGAGGIMGTPPFVSGGGNAGAGGAGVPSGIGSLLFGGGPLTSAPLYSVAANGDLVFTGASTAAGNATAAAGPLGLLSKLGPAGGLIALAAGLDLFSFNLGKSHGPVVGGISGFFLGGILGAVLGIFGGLFGGGKRKKQANNFFTQTLEPQIKQIEDQYKGFQLDFAGANSQLEQLRTQAQTELNKLKGEGKSVFKNKVGPAIDQAEKEIAALETERQRRSSLNFSPPEFHDGGDVNVISHRNWALGPGELLAVLREGEKVMNPRASAKYENVLDAMNAGRISATVMPFSSDGSGDTHFHGDIHIHAQTVDSTWLTRGGGLQAIRDGIRQMAREGKW